MSGPVVFVAGFAKAGGYLPSWVRLDCPPWVAIAFGPAITALGVASLWGLIAYVKLLARIVRRVLPAQQPVTVRG